MICLRRGLVIPRNVITSLNKKAYLPKLCICNIRSLQESPFRCFAHIPTGYSSIESSKDPNFGDNQLFTEESEIATNIKPENSNRTNDYFRFKDPEILGIKSLPDLKKFIAENADSLTAYQVVDILDKYNYFNAKEKWSNLKKLKVTDSKEFHVTLEALHKKLPELNVNEVVTILPFLSKMGISYKSQLMKTMMDIVMENENEISFVKSALLFHLFTLENIYQRFREKLKICVENYVLEKIENMNEFEILKAIHYASLNNFSLECNIKLLYAILDSKTLCRDPRTFGNYLKILRKIPKNNPLYSELNSKFFVLVEELKSNYAFLPDFCGFIRIYGNDVYYGDAEYDPKLVNDLIDGIITRNMSSKLKISCLSGLMVMNHIRHDFIGHVKDLILTDMEISNRDASNLMVFVNALADSHYCTVVPNESLEIKRFIESAEILNKAYEWKKLGLNHTISMAVDLLSIGLYIPRFFRFLSEECSTNTKIFESHLGRLKIILLINESLAVLHPKYAERFLVREKALEMFNKTKIKTNASEIRNKWLLDTKILFENSIERKNCVLYKCHTKQLQEIDFVVAVDEDGNPFDFSELDIKSNDCCIEDFNLPSRCKLILVFFVLEKEYNRNVKTLKALFTLKLKTLKTMGYRTLTIPMDEWTKVPENERGPYFWNLVKMKRNDLLLAPSYEFIGKKTHETKEIFENKDFFEENREKCPSALEGYS